MMPFPFTAAEAEAEYRRESVMRTMRHVRVAAERRSRRRQDREKRRELRLAWFSVHFRWNEYWRRPCVTC
jgi:hypothetical protein